MPRSDAGFEPADTAERLAQRLLGRRWITATDGLLEVTEVEMTRDRWPIALRFTVENDEWSAPRRFELRRSAADTVRGITAAENAEAMAEDGLALLELHLRTGQAPGVVELA